MLCRRCKVILRQSQCFIGLYILFQALIELLDQVEDVISVEPQCEEKIASHCHDGPAKPTAVLQKLAENFCSSDQRKESTINFLVLEVCQLFSYVNRPFMRIMISLL